jgi:hypothetical protein
MIFQWNEHTHAFSKKYGALYEIQRDTGFPMDDVIKAMKGNYPIGGFFYTRSPMIDLDAPQAPKKLKYSVKMSLMLSEDMVDEFLPLVGQRNKQDIIRGLIVEWMKKEKKAK